MVNTARPQQEPRRPGRDLQCVPCQVPGEPPPTRARIRAAQRQLCALPEGLVSTHLLEGRKECGDLAAVVASGWWGLGCIGVVQGQEPGSCRRIADKTPHHGPSRLNTPQHERLAEPWTVQHSRVRMTTARHACRIIPKPGVAGSIPAGGTRSPCSARFRIVRRRARNFRIGQHADNLPTCRAWERLAARQARLLNRRCLA
jgi:hypothetical protein